MQTSQAHLSRTSVVDCETAFEWERARIWAAAHARHSLAGVYKSARRYICELVSISEPRPSGRIIAACFRLKRSSLLGRAPARNRARCSVLLDCETRVACLYPRKLIFCCLGGASCLSIHAGRPLAKMK